MATFIEALEILAVNVYSPNENFRLGDILEGNETCLIILDEPIK